MNPLSRGACTLLVLLAGSKTLIGQDSLVVYVSHDQEHSQALIERFQRETGVKVDAQYDTEDNKTVGLVGRILAEKASPIADVFWNNECAQTERLKAMGLLEIYRSPSAEGIPAAFKDPDGTWTGFGARARVLIWNSTLIQESELPRTLKDLLDPKFRERFAMARPLTGTTLTHAGALYAELGPEETERWFDGLERNLVRWERGNAQVSRVVAEGTRAVGLTDTDDVHGRFLEGAPVRAHYLDQDPAGIGTLVIPNSVMILKGAKRGEAARRFVDFLISGAVERELAFGRAAQIPLRPGVEAPPHVRPASEIKSSAVSFAEIGRALETYKSRLDRRFVEGANPTRGPRSTSTTLWLSLGALAIALVFIWLAVKPRGARHG